MSISLPVRAVLLLAACTAPLQGAAQTGPSAPALPSVLLAPPAASARRAPPNPLDAKADVPAPRYESAFARFQRAGGDKPVPWRDANDSVTRIGGWRVHAREAQPAEAAPTATPPAAKPAATSADKVMPMPAGHGSHKAP